MKNYENAKTNARNNQNVATRKRRMANLAFAN